MHAASFLKEGYLRTLSYKLKRFVAFLIVHSLKLVNLYIYTQKNPVYVW